MKHYFLHYHPAVVFIYICSAIVSAMMSYAPVYVAISLLCASLCSVYFNGAKKYLRALLLLLPLLLLLIILTPLTNSRGATAIIDLRFTTVTAEAIIFGLCMGGMLISVFIWFQCYQKLITNDKFLFLFGRIAPTSSLIVSMIIKFIPVTGEKLRAIREAGKALSPANISGKDDKQKSAGMLAKMRRGTRMISILMSRCLEDSIETADSMRSRGYGTRRRTVFGAQRFTYRDGISACVCAGTFTVHLVFVVITSGSQDFFPFLTMGDIYAVDLCLYAVMLLWPLLIEVKDNLLYLAKRSGMRTE